ncbi:MAG: hypothetical protein ACRDWT_06565 [Jatrophihabitantaceae bacterium]
MTQFSLFGAAVAEPSLDDLDGVLLGGGHWVRSAMRGALPAGNAEPGAPASTGARLSVVVSDRWRADALAAEFGLRGVGTVDTIVPAEGGFGVRTAFATALIPGAQRWTRGANEGPPPDLVLTAGGLRLWTIAGGRPDDAGYLLATDEPDDAVHTVGGAQLSRLGLAAVSVSYRGGPGWRVTSVKRIRRLVELVGPPPEGAAADWPSTR